MTTHRFTVERVDVTTKGSFEQATAAFEENVPTADMTLLARLVEARSSAGEIQAAVAHMQGDLEFMIFAKLVQGSLTSQDGDALESRRGDLTSLDLRDDCSRSRKGRAVEYLSHSPPCGR